MRAHVIGVVPDGVAAVRFGDITGPITTTTTTPTSRPTSRLTARRSVATAILGGAANHVPRVTTPPASGCFERLIHCEWGPAVDLSRER
jgi:hypothetical protein